MEINRIEDVIIPRRVIGPDAGWEAEIAPIIEAYAADFGEELAAPAAAADLHACEQRLGTPLPADLRLFYQRFGAARLSEILCPLAEFSALGDDAAWLADFPPPEQAALRELVMFGEYLGNGNLWCFHRHTQAIYYFDHDTRPTVTLMFATFYEYLQALLIFTQGELGGHVEGLEEQCEALVAGLVGEERVRKWRY